MVPMTIHAAGCERIAARDRLAVEGARILLLLSRVAGTALYARGRRVGEILSFEIGVAAGAPEAGMYRGGKFLSIHI